MKNFIISLLIFLLWAFLGMWWYYSCPICETGHSNIHQQIEKDVIKVNKVTKTPITKVKNSLFNITNENGKTIFSFQDQLKIIKDSTSVDIPKSLARFKDSVFNYLNNNQNKELYISGWYNTEEIRTNNDSLNFGIQRANYLKTILVNFGLNTDKINTTGIKQNYKYTNGTYSGGIDLSFKEISETKFGTIDKGITTKFLYTKFNSREFIPDNTLITYTADLKNYLINNPNKTIKITGHTDSLGEESDNEIIGIDRATNVMNHFIAQGIDKTKLQVISKGELIPIADNTTNEGRAKNRRIEININ